VTEIHRGRWAKIEALGGDEIDAAIRAIVRKRLAQGRGVWLLASDGRSPGGRIGRA
jgi:3'-phosphoadenosine 5'-phosphosulfate sulfotransferase